MSDYPYIQKIENGENFSSVENSLLFDLGDRNKILLEICNLEYWGEDTAFWGVDGQSPKKYISNISFEIGGDFVALPPSSYNRLTEVHLNTIGIDGQRDAFTISFKGGDGSAAYKCSLYIQNFELAKREVKAAGGWVSEECLWKDDRITFAKYKNDYLGIEESYGEK